MDAAAALPQAFWCEFRAHKLFLTASSEKFATMFSSGMKEARSSVDEPVTLLDVTARDVTLFLKWAYERALPSDLDALVGLRRIGHMWMAQALEVACTREIMRQLAVPSITPSLEILLSLEALYDASILSEDCIWEYVTRWAACNVQGTFNSPKWPKLGGHAITTLMRQHHLFALDVPTHALKAIACWVAGIPYDMSKPSFVIRQGQPLPPELSALITAGGTEFDVLESRRTIARAALQRDMVPLLCQLDYTDMAAFLAAPRLLDDNLIRNLLVSKLTSAADPSSSQEKLYRCVLVDHRSLLANTNSGIDYSELVMETSAGKRTSLRFSDQKAGDRLYSQDWSPLERALVGSLCQPCFIPGRGGNTITRHLLARAVLERPGILCFGIVLRALHPQSNSLRPDDAILAVFFGQDGRPGIVMMCDPKSRSSVVLTDVEGAWKKDLFLASSVLPSPPQTPRAARSAGTNVQGATAPWDASNKERMCSSPGDVIEWLVHVPGDGTLGAIVKLNYNGKLAFSGTVMVANGRTQDVQLILTRLTTNLKQPPPVGQLRFVEAEAYRT
ncbi:hypothetical protein DFJ74DRAFT_317741 [Hyaloraphidium curvatum]|nr:hypothetical protein DFJ74DRAFT_317741 [Hyaloraphidium curvatum]